MIRAPGTSFVVNLVLDPNSWHRASETFIISRVIGLSFVLMRQLWMGCWMAPGWTLVTGKTNPWLEAQNFHLPHSLEMKEGLKVELMVNHAYVMKPPQNPKSTEFWHLSGWWTHGGAGRVACLFFIPCPTYLFCLAASGLYPFTIN